MAGSGGVGTMAIQLAKHLNAEVATTAGSGSAEMVRRLGADHVIDYKREDFSKLLNRYDVVLDTLGGEDLEKSFRVLKRGGKVVSLAGPPDPSVAEALGAGAVLKLLLGALSWNIRRKARKAGVTYSFLFMRPDGAQLAKLGVHFDSGKHREWSSIAPFPVRADAPGARLRRGRARKGQGRRRDLLTPPGHGGADFYETRGLTASRSTSRTETMEQTMKTNASAAASTKVALVTGASSGIGKATALALLRSGYEVFGTSRKAEPDEVADGIAMLRCDVRSDDSVAQAVAAIEGARGRIDLLVNNAGGGILAAAGGVLDRPGPRALRH